MPLWGPARVSKVRGGNVCQPRDDSAEDGCFLSAGAHCDQSALASLSVAARSKIRDIGPAASVRSVDAL